MSLIAHSLFFRKFHWFDIAFSLIDEIYKIQATLCAEC